MKNYFPLFIASLIACLSTGCLTPLARRWAQRWGIMDLPGPLKVQAKPIAYLGGLALYGGLCLGLILAYVLQPGLSGLWMFAIGLGGGVMAAAGLWDDARTLSPRARLAIELAIGVGFVLIVQAPWPWAALYALFFAVGCNAMNLVDGQDGLAGGMAALFGGGGVLLGLMENDPTMLLLGGVLLGASIAFLKFNWNPATILMGDCGSLLLGFWVAGMAVYWIMANSSWERALQMGLLFAFPLCDTALAFLRRLRRHQNAFQGDRDHLYDVLARTRLGTVGSTTFCLAVATGVAALALRLKP